MTFKTWLGLTGAAILAAIVVPYGLLSGGAAGTGIFLFWLGFALVVVALIVVGTGGWRR